MRKPATHQEKRDPLAQFLQKQIAQSAASLGRYHVQLTESACSYYHHKRWTPTKACRLPVPTLVINSLAKKFTAQSMPGKRPPHARAAQLPAMSVSKNVGHALVRVHQDHAPASAVQLAAHMQPLGALRPWRKAHHKLAAVHPRLHIALLSFHASVLAASLRWQRLTLTAHERSPARKAPLPRQVAAHAPPS